MAAGSIPLVSEDGVPLQEYRDFIASLPVDHRVVPVRLYQGFWWPESTLPGVIAVQRHFESRPDDVFLVTYPKSGTTWLKSLAYAVTTRSKYPLSDHPLLQLNPHQCVNSLERTFNRGRSSEIDALPSPRILATHMLHSVLPDSIAASDCRIVYLWRDPKDVIVSAWHFAEKVLGTREYQAEWPVDKVGMAHCEGISTHATVWDHILGYWRARVHRPEKILFLRYEELLAEPAANLKRMADFLGCPFSPEEEKAGVVEEIVNLCSFKNLSSLAINKLSSDVTDEGTKLQLQNNASFFRKGEGGDWRNHMSPGVARRMDEVTMEKLQGSGLSF
ncbi:hypothetical protein GW17_00062286 [Ensete ventricosum]|nr:hypothetical protein GW17_00062286 [Ensete ventricosum]